MRIDRFAPVLTFDDPKELKEFCRREYKEHLVMLIERNAFTAFRAVKVFGGMVAAVTAAYDRPLDKLNYPVQVTLFPKEKW